MIVILSGQFIQRQAANIVNKWLYKIMLLQLIDFEIFFY
jgi:predicted nucleotidyltransferase